MASPLEYTYPPGTPGQQTFTAEDDLARLLETLHTSGTLRALNGVLARFEDVTEVVLDGLDTDGGRNGLSNLLILAKLLGRIEADGMDRFVVALDRALEAAGHRITEEEDAPGVFGTLKKLRDPSVLRGLDAVLTFLGALGTQLHAPQPPVHSNQDGVGPARP